MKVARVLLHSTSEPLKSNGIIIGGRSLSPQRHHGRNTLAHARLFTEEHKQYIIQHCTLHYTMYYAILN